MVSAKAIVLRTPVEAMIDVKNTVTPTNSAKDFLRSACILGSFFKHCNQYPLEWRNRLFGVIAIKFPTSEVRMGSVIKKRRKRMSKKKHRKLLRKTRHQRRNKK
jgi:NAD/NADP transhydrogenase alpha subunit